MDERYIYFEVIPMYAMAKRSVFLRIKSASDKGIVGIADVGRVLVGIQDAVYHIAEMKFSDKGFRVSGKRDRGLDKRTKLRFIKVHMSDFESEISGEPQTAILGKTIVEEALDTFGSMCGTLNAKENPEPYIDNIIRNPLDKSRILKDFAYFWPGQENEYAVEVNVLNIAKEDLIPQKRPKIKEMAKYRAERTVQSLFGVLSEARFHGGKKGVELLGPHGKIRCVFRREMEDEIYNHLRKVVIISAHVEVDEVGNLRKITDLTSIKRFDSIPLSYIVTEEGEIALKKPINISISFEDENWVIEYEPLNIVAYDKEYDKVLEIFQKDFLFLYEHYFKGKPDNMVGNALKIREYLGKIVEDK